MFNRTSFTAMLALLGLLALPASAALLDGMQAYWGFDGNGNDGVGSVDLVANNVGSTISYATGLAGQAVLVPADSGSVGASFMGTVGAAGSNYNTTGKYITVSFWYKQTKAIGATGSSANVYHFGQTGYPDLSMYTKTVTGKGYAMISGGYSAAINSAFEAANVWQHRVLRFNRYATVHLEQWYATATDADHGTYDAYTTPWVDCVVNSANQLVIGKNPTSDNDIMYDEVAVWNRTLSEPEIEELFDMGKAGTALPEPVTLSILAIGGVLGLLRRSR